MEQSEQIDQLATALAKVQANLRPAQESARNPFLKNKYADLGDVWNACREVMTDNGISVAQFPTGDEGSIGLTTVLMHESGQWMSDTIHLPLFDEKGKSAAQVAGSVISYFRRYALSAVLGIVTGEDDDGTMGNDPRRDARADASPQAQRKRQRPGQNGGSNSVSGLMPDRAQAIAEARRAASNVIPAVQNTHNRYRDNEIAGKNAVKKVAKALGFDAIPGGAEDADERALIVERTFSYADLRDAGMDGDEALAIVKGEKEAA